MVVVTTLIVDPQLGAGLDSLGGHLVRVRVRVRIGLRVRVRVRARARVRVRVRPASVATNSIRSRTSHAPARPTDLSSNRQLGRRACSHKVAG